MMNRTFGPKKADHPSVGDKCPICGEPFRVGDYTTLIEMGANNPENMRRQRDDLPYNAVAREVHAECREKQ